MGSKAMLFVVLGFSLTFLMIGNNFNRMTISAMDNMTYYSCRQISHNIALTGANIALSEFYKNHYWSGGYSNIPCQGGSFNITVQTIAPLDSVKTITSVSTFQGYYSGYTSITYHDTVIITLQPASFAQFVYYSSKEVGGIYWMTGDTTTGRFHIQDYIYIQGNPFWYGYATSLNGIFWHGGTSNNPTFAAGFQAGVNIPINQSAVTNSSAAAIANGKYFTGHPTVYLTFKGDSISYRYVAVGPDSTRLASTFAPNGVIFVNGGDLRIQKSVVKGSYSICTTNNVYLDDDVVYTSDPIANPACTDYLGMIVGATCVVTNNTANWDGINIDASIYCQGNGGNSGTFYGDNYNNGLRGGPINLIGGIIQNNKGQINTTDNTGALKTGWNKHYRFDNRLTYHSPPVFPGTGQNQIISWYESTLNNATDRGLY